ncbi:MULTISPECIES: aminotransferase class V-fold PLP-dependent enzyme [unclassified Ruegeria]|uniref:pyridoxal-phosphate-dependent aminotransferase family protein n=1 Tax=unclassified Ruegeria TaxID=2625375 RepID=UPI001ADC1594|nr:MULTISPECIES: aminotransferase class V-fold PLP-dependent enzyme [unclassified Ruegeria]MBO9410089.1 alanine--glyoxylate aminotransferase family protein [Ruegeria sp. R8_1]MBO9414692.1 alanine--glyoxylate aminotransferase family protein [Ruegeria sp. R8_2]
MTNHISLAQGREYLAIPGPSVMPDAVLQAMHRPSPNIYDGELIEMMPALTADLKRVARTDHHVAIYIANGHGTWEAALSNVIAPGETVLAPASGRFTYGWAEMAEGIGATAQVINFGTSSAWDFDLIADALRADKAHEIKAVLAVHVDTSSSIRNDIPALRALLDDLNHPALLMADCIASLGCDRFEMDAWGVDVMVTACQKGLMTPAGIGFVYFNEKAAAKRAAMPRVSQYWDWIPRTQPELFYQYFNGTAPTHHLYGLRAALDLIHAEGIEHVWARHERLATAIWAACETWADCGALHLNVADRTHRSHAVTALRLTDGQGTPLRRFTETQLGLTLGIGLGMEDWDGCFRLGHMGHVNGQMVMAMLGGMETAMAALNIPRGTGALEAAAAILAE